MSQATMKWRETGDMATTPTLSAHVPGAREQGLGKVYRRFGSNDRREGWGECDFDELTFPFGRTPTR